MLCGSDMWVLINYMSFVQWLSVGGSIAGMIYLRVTQPDRPRPIKVGPTARQAPPHEGKPHCHRSRPIKVSPTARQAQPHQGRPTATDPALSR